MRRGFASAGMLGGLLMDRGRVMFRGPIAAVSFVRGKESVMHCSLCRTMPGRERGLVLSQASAPELRRSCAEYQE